MLLGCGGFSVFGLDLERWKSQELVHIFAETEGENSCRNKMKEAEAARCTKLLDQSSSSFCATARSTWPTPRCTKIKCHSHNTQSCALKYHINLVAITAIITAITTHMQLSSNSFFKPAQLLISHAPTFISNNGYLKISNARKPQHAQPLRHT